MKHLILAALAVGSAVAAVAPVEASGGCGPAFHRGPYGGCRPNRGPVFVGPGGPVVGVYYPRRGYWYGNRYWWHRDRWHGGWRYR